MLDQAALDASPGRFASALLDYIEAHGSRTHSHVQRLGNAAVGAGILGDAIHFLTLIHGRPPSIIEVARAETAPRQQPAVADWLAAAATMFEGRRRQLTRLAVAASSSPFLAELTATERIVSAQRDAMLMLARSDRIACAVGASVALLHDWEAIGAVLRGIDRRFGGAPAHDDGPTLVMDRTATHAALTGIATTTGARRALMFGVTQMIAQHRALWDLLEARQAAHG